MYIASFESQGVNRYIGPFPKSDIPVNPTLRWDIWQAWPLSHQSLRNHRECQGGSETDEEYVSELQRGTVLVLAK